MSNIVSNMLNNEIELTLTTNVSNIKALELIEELLKDINYFDWHEKTQAKLLLENIIELSQITLKDLG